MPGDPYAIDARFYDAIHDGHREDVGLWLSFAGRTDRPVLEVGTGTGRIAVELARAGHTVVAIDPSDAMLERARRRNDEFGLDVEFVEGRLTDLALEREKYGLAILPADVFLYCADGEEQLAWLRALADALALQRTARARRPGAGAVARPDDERPAAADIQRPNRRWRALRRMAGPRG